MKCFIYGKQLNSVIWKYVREFIIFSVQWPSSSSQLPSPLVVFSPLYLHLPLLFLVASSTVSCHYHLSFSLPSIYWTLFCNFHYLTVSTWPHMILPQQLLFSFLLYAWCNMHSTFNFFILSVFITLQHFLQNSTSIALILQTFWLKSNSPLCIITQCVVHFV